MENILRFEETTFKKTQDDWQSFDGYVITTNKQGIKIGISNGQECCEFFGYFSSADNLEDFVGATIKNITITDIELQTGLANKHDAEYLDEGGIMFVNIETNRGIVQFAAYNGHNGYYGHEAVIISEQLTHEEDL